MTSIIIPGKSGVIEVKDPQGGLWEIGEKTMPQGFRIVATVDRPDGDIYDLGQNAEGKFALFRRSSDPWGWWSYGKMERMSDQDIAGFGLLRAVCAEPDPDLVEEAHEWGEHSSLCVSNLIPTQTIEGF